MSSIKKLLSDSIIYGLSTIVGRMVSFLLVPFYTTFFTTQDFGEFAEVYALVAFLNVFCTFGLETTYFRKTKDHLELDAYRSTFRLLIIVNSVFLGSILLFKSQIAGLTGYSDRENVFLIAGLIIVIDAITALPFARLRQLNKSLKFSALKLLSIVINIGLNVIAFVFLELHEQQYSVLEVVLICNLISNSVVLLFFVPDFLSAFGKVTISFKELFQYGFPIMLLGIGGMVNEVLDRQFLKYLNFGGDGLTNIERVGVYSAVYKLSIFITLANQAFRYAAEPFFFKKSNDQNAQETYAKVLKGYAVFTLAMFVFVACFRNEIGTLLLRNEAFHVGLDIVPVLLLANVFLGIYYNQSIWYKLTDKTFYGTRITLFGGLITLGMNWLLIPIIGYWGSAWATLACYISITVISYYYGQKYYPVPYQLGKILLFILIASFLVLITYLEIGNSILVKTVLVFSYLAFVFLMEFKKLKQLLKK